MNMHEIIQTKRDGKELSKQQIEFFVKGSTTGDIPDYQITALLMAVFLNGLNKEETFELTRQMRDSGDTLDLSKISGIKVDKHSTGGVGDKTTLITAPLAAAAGVPVAKMSGRGLGFTGGTIDKLESIPGFMTSLSIDDFIRTVNDHRICVIGQTAQVATADKKFYALRDVTATVDNISLIASSIMSKKLALGSDAILLDVKCGQAAFMEDPEQAKELGQLMVEIGRSCGKKTVAVVTAMDQPLGRAVGNALEVKEAIETLKGNGPEDIMRLSVTLAGIMAYLSGKAGSTDEGISLAKSKLAGGEGLEKLKEMIGAQGGDERVTEDTSLLPSAKFSADICSDKDGFVSSISGKQIGIASMHSGAGRQTAGDAVDPSAGIYIGKKVGEAVSKGEALCTVYSDDEAKLALAVSEAQDAFEISEEKPAEGELILMTLE